jgi:hypothetical protein
VALLEKRRLLARRTNRADMRETFLSLTPAGRAIYEDLAPIALAFAKRLSEVVTPQDRDAFDRALTRLTERSAMLAIEVADTDKTEAASRRAAAAVRSIRGEKA